MRRHARSVPALIALTALCLPGTPGPDSPSRALASGKNDQEKAVDKSPRRIGPIVIIGGHEDREGGEEVLRRFVKLAGGDDARIAFITAASEEPKTTEKKYREAFGAIGVKDLRFLDTPDRGHTDTQANLDAVRRATGVFFTGGDQQRLVTRVRNTKLDRLLHERHLEGMAIAGTSAGASMMSELMADGGENESAPRAGLVELGYGLDFLPGVMVDSHFSQRGRLGRLLSVLAIRPQVVAIGIDENTAVVVTGGDRAEVVGTGVVTVIDVSHMTHNNREGRRKGEAISLFGMTLHTLARGSRFDLKTLTPKDTDDPKQFPDVAR